MGKIRVAIAGLGNCASSLIQGVEYYKSLGEGGAFAHGVLCTIISAATGPVT